MVSYSGRKSRNQIYLVLFTWPDYLSSLSWALWRLAKANLVLNRSWTEVLRFIVARCTYTAYKPPLSFGRCIPYREKTRVSEMQLHVMYAVSFPLWQVLLRTSDPESRNPQNHPLIEENEELLSHNEIIHNVSIVWNNSHISPHLINGKNFSSIDLNNIPVLVLWRLIAVLDKDLC